MTRFSTSILRAALPCAAQRISYGHSHDTRTHTSTLAPIRRVSPQLLNVDGLAATPAWSSTGWERDGRARSLPACRRSCTLSQNDPLLDIQSIHRRGAAEACLLPGACILLNKNILPERSPSLRETSRATSMPEKMKQSQLKGWETRGRGGQRLQQ